jgi:uncharacterized protein
MEREIRAIQQPIILTQLNVEERALKPFLNEAGDVICGTGTVFNQRSEFLGFFYEKIERTALDNVDLTDVIGQFDHKVLLGRTGNNTLNINIDDEGLKYEIYPSDATDNKDAVIKVKRGDVVGSSFIFTTAEDGVEYVKQEDGTWLRTVHQIARYYETGPVSLPAYKQTDATYGKRQLDSFLAEQSEGLRKDLERSIKEQREIQIKKIQKVQTINKIYL